MEGFHFTDEAMQLQINTLKGLAIAFGGTVHFGLVYVSADKTQGGAIMPDTIDNDTLNTAIALYLSKQKKIDKDGKLIEDES